MGLNTKCKVHGNAHPDFMCPDEDEDTTSFARSLAAARLEVAAKESELSVVQRDLNGANAYIEEVRNQRDRGGSIQSGARLHYQQRLVTGGFRV